MWHRREHVILQPLAVGEHALLVTAQTEVASLAGSGFFILRNGIFEYINDGEELVEQPLLRLIKKRKISAYPHTGFWQAMDTFKNKIEFDRSYARGDAPWQVWLK